MTHLLDAVLPHALVYNEFTCGTTLEAATPGVLTTIGRSPLSIESTERRCRCLVAAFTVAMRWVMAPKVRSGSGGYVRKGSVAKRRSRVTLASGVYVYREKWANQHWQGRHGLQVFGKLVFTTTTVITKWLVMGKTLSARNCGVSTTLCCFSGLPDKRIRVLLALG